MIHKFLFIVLLVCSSDGHSAINFEINTYQILDRTRVHTYSAAFKCYGGKDKGDESTVLPAYSAENSGKGEISNGTQAIKSHYLGVETRNLTISASEKSAVKGHLEATVSLSDSASSPQVWTDGSGCKKTYHQVAVKNNQIQGNIEISYTVPSNVWMIAVNRSSFEGKVFKSSNYAISGTLNRSASRAYSTSENLWVTPGSVVKFSFSIPRSSPSIQNAVSFQLSIKPMGEVYADEHKFGENWSRLSDISKKQKFNVDEYGEILSFIRSRENITEFLKDLPADNLMSTSRLFFDQALDTDVENIAEYDNGVVGYLVTFEISIAFLNSIEPFCKTVTVDLPITGRSAEISGLRAAQYFLWRMRHRISYYDFGIYESILLELQRLGNNNGTYKSVWNDVDLREDLAGSFDLLRLGVSPASVPFKDAVFDVKNILREFGNVGASDASTQTLVANLEALAELESQFTNSFFNHLRRYRERTDETVNVDDLVDTIDKLVEGKKDVLDLMSEQITVISADTSGGGNTVFDSLVEAIDKQINIFRDPVKFEYFDKVASKYFESRNVEPLIEKMNNCLYEG